MRKLAFLSIVLALLCVETVLGCQFENLRGSFLEFSNYVDNHPDYISSRDNGGRTPLHKAATCKRADAIAFLLESRPSIIDELDYSGASALHTSAENNCVDCVRFLLERSKDKNVCLSTFYSKNTPLHYAVKGENVEIIQMILTFCYRSIYKKNDDGETPLSIATAKDDPDISQIFNYLDVKLSDAFNKLKLPLDERMKLFGW